MSIDFSAKIHHTSIIDENVSIGKKSVIWHWVHLSSNSKIGENCSLGQNVFIGRNVVLGNNVKIQNNVSVYENVFLEDNVFCGPSMVFTNVINPRSQVNRKDEFKKTYVERGVTIGANATILCGLRIGKYAFIGAGTLVTKNVKPFALMVGVPAKQVGWMSAYGEKIEFPDKGKKVWVCAKTNDRYEYSKNSLKYIPGSNK